MRGKHKDFLVHALAHFGREYLRFRIRRLVNWTPLANPEPGCTAIIGVCSKLPDVLFANLRCLQASRWPELVKVLLVVDCTRERFSNLVEDDIKRTFDTLNINVLYYSPQQSDRAEALKLPFVYSWLSWCIALAHVTTEHVLFHDYDALVLNSALARRYRQFAASGATVQGISWYKANGLAQSDRLATTFEAFMDTKWLRSSPPLAHFNKLRILDCRSVDYDTTLAQQHSTLSPEARTIAPMAQEDLVHPSQMIHQYTMFRRHPAAKLPCFSIPMIPFFFYLSGRVDLLRTATRSLAGSEPSKIELIGDGVCINFSMLDLAQVDWALKQMVQACLSLSVVPDNYIYRYGDALYRLVGASPNEIWKGDFTDQQR